MQAGARLGPFEIEKPLGSGAMGQVFRAKYVKTGQRVAVKIMAPGMAANEQALARFHREADVLKQLKHPNIVKFYAAGMFEGSPYYAMEYIEGESLDALLQRRGRLTWEEIVELGKQVCAALQHAHERGIVHRDLKPSNLILTPSGVLKLADFGIAKDLDQVQLTVTNTTVGTAAYMSPEQCRGERVITHKSDLYSLGVMLYELLTGSKPFKAETTMDMFPAHVNGKFERPSRIALEIPVWLDTIVCQLLEKEPDKRPYDASVVSEALERVAEKVTAQQSAGVDAAKSRKKASSADEKEVLRTLSGRKGKRKRKSRPFYERVWFQVMAILLLLGAMAAVVYAVFFTPPNPDSLYRQVKIGMESSEKLDRKRARELIEVYLKFYGTRDDPQAQQIHRWADQYDLATAKDIVQSKFAEEDEGKPIAASALKFEEAGQLEDAKVRWQQLLKLGEQPSGRGWKLLAEEGIQNQARAVAREQELGALLADLRREGGEKPPPSDEWTNLALRAMRFETLGDLPRAEESWKALRDKLQGGQDRPFYLIATRQLAALEREKPERKIDKQQRAEMLNRRLMEIQAEAKDRPQKARLDAEELLFLYTADAEDAIKDVLMQVRELLKKLPQ